jgi:hypothetical protein
MSLDWTPCARNAAGWQDATVPDDRVSQFFASIGIKLTPKQYDFITCPADDVGFGGSRGGAKSVGVVLDWVWHDHEHGENANGAVFRRERVQLQEFIREAEGIFSRINATISEPKAPKWKWHHQGQYFESPRIYIEERGTFPRERPLNMILGTLRSGRGVPCQMKSTFNPGGVGHLHCKDRYKLHERFPRGYEIFKTEEGATRCFIPSKLRDNPHLGESYVRTLRAACAGNEALLNAWLDGDWSLVEGAFFHDWRAEHVIAEFEIPDDWQRFRSFHWGSARPASVGWWAVARNVFVGRDIAGNGDAVAIPQGALVRYREWYAQKSVGSNEGLKLTAEQIAEGIKQRERGERVAYGVASPAIFQSTGGPSIAERLGRAGLWFIPGDDAKVAKMGHLSGWDALRQRLVGTSGNPAIFCFQSCADSVRTIPALQHDRDDPEEIDGESEAAAAHDWRYACMSRPWSPSVVAAPKPKFITVGGETTVTLDDLWKAKAARRSTRI